MEGELEVYIKNNNLYPYENIENKIEQFIKEDDLRKLIKERSKRKNRRKTSYVSYNRLANFDKEFKNFLKTFLKIGKLREEYIEIITNITNIKMYERAFTTRRYNNTKNYEVFEFLGDLTINKCIGWYFFNRLNMLDTYHAEGYLTELKQRYSSKIALYNLGKKYGFNNFIHREKTENIVSNIEDVFEAFFGATEYLIDKNIKKGYGFSICYNIIEWIFDNIDISLKYEDISMPIKMFNEFCIKTDIGHRVDRDKNTIRIYVSSNPEVLISEEVGDNMDERDFKCYEKAISKLQELGYKQFKPKWWEIDSYTIIPNIF